MVFSMALCRGRGFVFRQDYYGAPSRPMRVTNVRLHKKWAGAGLSNVIGKWPRIRAYVL
jgi:hypothetical protein